MELINTVRERGIVGAGGAGFPTHVKLSQRAEIVIVNAAECEPLLHKDKELLHHKSEEFFRGLVTAMNLVGARRAIIGIKAKYEELISRLKQQAPAGVEVCPIRDFYPAGDEITLVHETTGRIVGAGQLPSTQNVVVQNVETLFNLGLEGPVITKFITVAGDVENPLSVEAPLGTPMRLLLNQARPLAKDFRVIVGGPMMGRLLATFDEPVTKTTGGLIVLPADHILVRRYTQSGSEAIVRKIGKSSCDQCTFCTEFCPRYLLGHPIQPHKAMRGLIFQNAVVERPDLSRHTQFCCECNLCSFYACPEDLLPSQVCILDKRALAKGGLKYQGPILNEMHPSAEYRKVPVKKLMAKLDLLRFTNKGPLVSLQPSPNRLKILLKQHIGTPATVLVKPGEKVGRCHKIASCEGRLGSEIHSPVDGRVMEITTDAIVIER